MIGKTHEKYNILHHFLDKVAVTTLTALHEVQFGN